MNELIQIQELLKEKADCQARLNLMPYDGSPEIKTQNEKKYLYVRKRVAGKLTSTYVDVYSDDLLRNARESRTLNKRIAGRGFYQEEGKEAVEMKPGSCINIPAEVKHWHGAAPDEWFSHLAIEVPGVDCSNEWCEAVSEEEYMHLK